jgi:hypothetical protein
MKKTTQQVLAVLAAVGLMTILSAPTAQAITINFASDVTGGSVQFTGTGDTFTFHPTAANQFTIGSSSGVGDSIGDLGFIGGTFTIGAITTDATGQSAPVTGTGSITIHGGAGTDLTGTLVWNKIRSSGTGGIMNVDGVINLAAITYTGGQSDLIALKNAGSAIQTVTFQFIPGLSLTTLTTDGQVNSTSFSGTIATASVPDGGLTMALLGFALMGIEGLRRKLSR